MPKIQIAREVNYRKFEMKQTESRLNTFDKPGAWHCFGSFIGNHLLRVYISAFKNQVNSHATLHIRLWNFRNAVLRSETLVSMCLVYFLIMSSHIGINLPVFFQFSLGTIQRENWLINLSQLLLDISSFMLTRSDEQQVVGSSWIWFGSIKS